jgi:benzil reductase ((S)-benzoin forming)
MKKSLLILTGHTGGLGKAILTKFLREDDFQIVAISRRSLQLDHSQVTEISFDLSDLSSLETKLPLFFPKGKFEKILLINNAGWIGEIKKVGKLHSMAITKALNLNLLAPMILSDAFVRAYGETDCEKLICNISSGAAHKPLSGWAEYCSSKAGLAMFSKVAAEDLKQKGFKVYSLAPGIVDTEMQAEIRKADQSEFPALERFTKYKSEGQLSPAEEVADKIFYLLSHPELFPEVIQDVRDFDLP